MDQDVAGPVNYLLTTPASSVENQLLWRPELPSGGKPLCPVEMPRINNYGLTRESVRKSTIHTSYSSYWPFFIHIPTTGAAKHTWAIR